MQEPELWSDPVLHLARIGEVAIYGGSIYHINKNNTCIISMHQAIGARLYGLERGCFFKFYVTDLLIQFLIDCFRITAETKFTFYVKTQGIKTVPCPVTVKGERGANQPMLL